MSEIDQARAAYWQALLKLRPAEHVDELRRLLALLVEHHDREKTDELGTLILAGLAVGPGDALSDEGYPVPPP